MIDHRFDRWTRRLVESGSRRTFVGVLAGGVVAAFGRSKAEASNAECAHYCNAAFTPGRERGKCKSEAAHGRGPCYQCGPRAAACPSGQSRPSRRPPCPCRCTVACPGAFQDPVTCECRGGDAPRCDGVPCTAGRRCGGSPNCFCNRSVEGVGFCIRTAAAECQAFRPCDTSADCPRGLCLDLRGCCDEPRLCVPLSASCTAGGGAAPSVNGSAGTGWRPG